MRRKSETKVLQEADHLLLSLKNYNLQHYFLATLWITKWDSVGQQKSPGLVVGKHRYWIIGQNVERHNSKQTK